MMKSKDSLQVGWEGGGICRETVCNMCNEVNKVAEGDYAGGGCSAWGGEEDIALRLILPILVEEVFAI